MIGFVILSCPACPSSHVSIQALGPPRLHLSDAHFADDDGDSEFSGSSSDDSDSSDEGSGGDREDGDEDSEPGSSDKGVSGSVSDLVDEGLRKPLDQKRGRLDSMEAIDDKEDGTSESEEEEEEEELVLHHKRHRAQVDYAALHVTMFGGPPTGEAEPELEEDDDMYSPSKDRPI